MRVVCWAVAAKRRDDRERDRDHDRDQDRVEQQVEGDGDALGQDRADPGVLGDRFAEIEVDGAGDEIQVLGRQRAVEAELFVQRRNRFGGGPRARG